MCRVLVLICVFLSALEALGEETISTNRALKISSAVSKLPGAKVTMIVGTLRRTNDSFAGVYELKVTPFFFMNEKGIVTIELGDKAIAKAAGGAKVEVKGRAWSYGPGRPLTAVATPIDADHGSLTIVIHDEDRDIRFLTDYRFLAR